MIFGGKGWSQAFFAAGGSLALLAAIFAASVFPKDTDS